jgi:AcrR family transcriptional regulator
MSPPVPRSPLALGPASLPLANAVPERADAARNRARLLDAAARLVAERGAEHVTMEAVAAAAGVGKGTVFRRFGDRTGLMLALLDRTEQDYQRGFLFGPPPLGPGAPPAERLHAFGFATIRLELDNLGLYLATVDGKPEHYGTPPRLARFAHASMLLRSAEVHGDVDILTEVLLDYLEVSFLEHLHGRRGMPMERIEAGWCDLVRRVLG